LRETWPLLLLHEPAAVAKKARKNGRKPRIMTRYQKGPDAKKSSWNHRPVDRASRTSGSCGGNEHRTGSRCMFKLFCLFACLFSFDKHRASSIEHRASSIEHRTTGRGPRSYTFGASSKRQGAACL